MQTDTNNPYEIAGLILAYLREDLEEENRRQLEIWLNESETNRKLFEQLTNENLQNREVKKILAFRTHTLPAWENIRKRIQRRNHIRRTWGKVAQLAALAILAIGISLAVYLYKEPASLPDTVLSITPGKPMAKLTIGNGATYVLDTMTRILLPNTAIRNGNEIIFSERDSASSPTFYNKLEIPQGGEYRITLADGTLVYLNSQTELEFPDRFNGARERIVSLKGEAYFKVAPNSTQPFIVKCGEYNVKVTGTTFNISNYTDDPYSHTTLESGKVEILYGNKQIALEPGQQALLKEGQLGIRKVNVRNYTTWMKESFRFEQESIEEILKRLARWYVVDIFYTDPSLKDYHFTGYLPRYTNISEVLELLSYTTNIRFEVKDKTVIVLKK